MTALMVFRGLVREKLAIHCDGKPELGDLSLSRCQRHFLFSYDPGSLHDTIADGTGMLEHAHSVMESERLLWRHEEIHLYDDPYTTAWRHRCIFHTEWTETGSWEQHRQDVLRYYMQQNVNAGRTFRLI